MLSDLIDDPEDSRGAFDELGHLLRRYASPVIFPPVSAALTGGVALRVFLIGDLVVLA